MKTTTIVLALAFFALVSAGKLSEEEESKKFKEYLVRNLFLTTLAFSTEHESTLGQVQVKNWKNR